MTKSYASLTVIAVALGLIPIAVMSLWVYMSVTATPLHTKAEEVPSVSHSAAAPKWAGPVERARQAVRESLLKQNLPGLSVAVGTSGSIVWAAGFGFADVDKREPVTPNHRFRIGTASTVLTSAAVGLLLEKGRLKLDDPIQTYLPAFPKKQWPVTLRQVMGHLAGLENDGGDEAPLLAKHCERPVEALPHFANASLLFQPGTEYKYSSYSWILVSGAVEAAAGEPLLEFMRREIFDPLGMPETMPDTAKVGSETKRGPNGVTSYFPRFIEDANYGVDLLRDIDLSCYAGSSVYLSTPSDLVRFGMAINSGKLLQRDTVQLLQTSQRLASGKETGYGLGWDLETITLAGKQTRVAGHDGVMLGGMVASLITVPEHELVVAVTSNISHAGTFSLAVKVAQAFAEQGSPAPR